MLKQAGFSLLEMLLSITLSSLIFIAVTEYYFQIQAHTLQYYRAIHLQQTVQQALFGIAKDIKRAGFIANDPSKPNKTALAIINEKNCIIIRYDSQIRHDWIDDASAMNNADSFVYRFINNNIEYKTGATACNEPKWEKLFDPAEIKVTTFHLKQQANSIEIVLAAELKQHQQVKYQISKIVRNENFYPSKQP